MAISFFPENSYPQNLEDGFPVGQSFYLAFSNSVDLKLLKKSCVLFGKDFDTSSGPNNALAVDLSTGDNPFFLKSPGMNGFIECEFEEYFVDDFSDEAPAAIQYILTRANEKKTIVKVTPKTLLGENNEYQLFLLGTTSENIEAGIPDYVDILAKNNTLSERTIFDVKDSNSAFEERISSRGSYESKNTEVSASLNIKIVEAGQGSKAKFIWWFSDEAEPLPANPSYKKRLSRCAQRWRNKDRGLMLRFADAEYVLNETFTVDCFAVSELETSYLITFRTSTDSVYEYPDQVSSSPIGLGANIIPGLSGIEEKLQLRITKIEPANNSINNKLDLKNIIIYFNENIDANSVTQDSIKVRVYPVSGVFDSRNGYMDREYELYKIISVEDNKILLEL